MSTSGCLANAEHDRRYGEEPRDLVVLGDRQCLLEIETRHRHDRDAIGEQPVHQDLHAVDVEERQRCKATSPSSSRQDMFDLCDVGGQIAVGEHDALAATGRAR